MFEAFKAGLRVLGYSEGTDYVAEHRSAQNDIARLPALAAELHALKVDLIVVASTPSALAASKASREIPVLITTIGDPIGNGLAASLRRPGGNVTGLTNQTTDLDTKRLDLMRQVVPGMRRVGFLYDPGNAGNLRYLELFDATCDKLHVKSIRAQVSKEADIAMAFATLRREQAQGLVVSGNSSNYTWQSRIFEHAAKLRLPAIYNQEDYVADGGLMSYAANYPDLSRRAAAYADKIFKGAKPGDLPIEQPMKFDFVINLKTAQALGIKIPGSVLVQATKVIE
jgi:putative ABC transport system substrate-binding protein